MLNTLCVERKQPEELQQVHHQLPSGRGKTTAIAQQLLSRAEHLVARTTQMMPPDTVPTVQSGAVRDLVRDALELYCDVRQNVTLYV